MKRAIFSFLVFAFSFFVFTFFLNASSAYAACTTNPTIFNYGFTDGVRSVTYNLRIRNNCPDAQKIRIRLPDNGLPNVSQNPGDFVPNRSVQDRLNANWRVNDNAWDEPLEINFAGYSTRNINVTVRRILDTYHPDGTYGYVKIRAALVSNTSSNDTIKVVYIVVNRPDLIVNRFEFPGGPTCQTTDTIVRIRNQGWKEFSDDFDVRVFNGNDNNGRTFRVTQFVDAREFINLDSRFNNMNLPPVGIWTAKAVVDFNNDIREEAEGNNEETDKYNTTTCVTPPPTNPPATPTTPPVTNPPPPSGTYSITGSTVHDNVIQNNLYDSGETFSTPYYELTGPNGYSRQIRGTSSQPVTFSGLEPGTYRFTDTAGQYYLDNGWSITYPTSYSGINPNFTVTVGPSCNTNGHTSARCTNGNITNLYFFKLTDSEESGGYTISGGVYDDADESRTKQASESYIGGNIRIINSSGATVASPTSNPGTGFTSNPLPAGRYTISYIDAVPPDSIITYPTNLSVPPSVSITLGLSNCSDGGGDSSCLDGNIINLNFGIYKPLITATPWIHAFGGDMRVDREMNNIIPNGFHFSEEFNASYTLTPGIVFGGSKLALGTPKDEKASINKWLVNSPYSFPKVNSSYNSMFDILDKGGVLSSARSILTQACNSSIPPNCTLDVGLPGGVYTADRYENVTLNPTIPGSPYTFPSRQNYIFLIYEDLVINTDIWVPKGTTVMFIVKGNITVSENVKRIDGIFSTDNNFTVEACECIGDDVPLTINGSVIANAALNQYHGETPGEFINERSLGARNETESTVKFNFRPDFILNMPEFIRYTGYSIREVAPGSNIKP